MEPAPGPQREEDMTAKQEANPAKLASFIRKHHAAGNALHAATEPEGIDLVDLFVHSYLLWQAPSADANQALKRLKAAFFDWNDMRVSLTSDIIDAIGHRYWRAGDRVAKLRDAMNAVYRREHKVCLDRLRTLMKKDAVSYMETLPGMLPFVSSRVLLVGVDFHSVPLEEFGLQLLVQHGAIPQGMSLSEAQGWVSRHVKAEEARDAHRALTAAVDNMWETSPPKLPKSATKPAEMAPPKPLEEARAAARALVEAQLAAERAALMAERAARREEMRREKAALKAKEARLAKGGSSKAGAKVADAKSKAKAARPAPKPAKAAAAVAKGGARKR